MAERDFCISDDPRPLRELQGLLKHWNRAQKGSLSPQE